MVSYRKELAHLTNGVSRSAALLSACEDHNSLSRALSQLADTEEKVFQFPSINIPLKTITPSTIFSLINYYFHFPGGSSTSRASKHRLLHPMRAAEGLPGVVGSRPRCIPRAYQAVPALAAFPADAGQET